MRLDVLGQLVTLSEREAEQLRVAAEADAGHSTARRDLAVLLERGLAGGGSVALSRTEGRELLSLISGRGGSSRGLLREALVRALGEEA